MAGLSPTQRTLRALRQQGCLCGMVEKWNAFAGPIIQVGTRKGQRTGIRQDLFGFLDIIALYPERICGIQSCGSAFSEHKKKILENEIAPEWLRLADIELWAWRRIKKVRGGKQMIWSPRVHKFSLSDFS